MSDEKQVEESPAIKEFNALLRHIPATAVKLFPPIEPMVKYIGKIIRRQDALEARLDKIEAKS